MSRRAWRTPVTDPAAGTTSDALGVAFGAGAVGPVLAALAAADVADGGGVVAAAVGAAVGADPGRAGRRRERVGEPADGRCGGGGVAVQDQPSRTTGLA
jgi:hypothetical protein